jgi:hypothetical protein
VTAIVRPRLTWQRLGVGKSKFYKDYVKQEGGDEFIPGTKVRRLRPMPLGKVAVGFPDDEIDAVIDGLREERDAAGPSSRTAAARDPASGKFQKSTKEIRP